jgi:hypothetical protein
MRMHFRGDEQGPIDCGRALTDLRFEIPQQESVKDVVGQKCPQQETLDGPGIVLEYMIGIPAGGEFVKAIIFDVPARVPQIHYLLGGQLSGGNSGDPKPVTGLENFLALELTPDRIALPRTNGDCPELR